MVVKDSSGTTISSMAYGYDNAGNVLTMTDADGNVTSNTYDGGELRSVVLKNSSGTTIRSTAQTFDLAGNVLTSTSGDGTVTSNTYDGGELRSVVVKNSSGTTIGSMAQTFDNAGYVLTSTDGDGNITSNTYDGGEMRSVVVKNSSGTTITSMAQTFDNAGEVLTSTDGDGNITSNSYDGGRLVSSILKDSGGTTVRSMAQTFDNDGNVLTSTDGTSNVTTNTYDGDRLTSRVVHASGGATVSSESWTYDNNGNVLTVIDGDGNVTSNSYDGNRLISVTVHDSSSTLVSSESFAYDNNGNQTRHVDPDGRTISSTWDANRLMSQTWYNSGGTAIASSSYSYDADGNILTASNAAGTYTNTYDGDRLHTQITPSGLTLTYGYDNNENVTSIVDSAGGTTTMTWNASGQLITKIYHDSSSAFRDDFTYDTAGNMLTATRYSDVTATTKIGFTQYAYDGNRVTDIQHQDGSSTVLASFSYQYDNAGRLITEIDNGTTTNYSYDASGQLTSAGATNYSYDGNGVASGTGHTTGPNNQLASDGTWNYFYDVAGNMTQKVNIATGTTWDYGYDTANHLISATETDSSSTVLVSATYTYDVFGMRVQSSVSLNGGAATVTKFVYNGRMLYATLDASGTVITRYIAGAQADEWLANVTSGTVNWYLTDHLGSVRAIVNNAGGYVNQLDYDAYGNITHNATPANTGILTYAGYIWEAALGLFDDDHRWLDPKAQQFMTKDPSGLGPDENPRRDVGNGPTNATDPSGLEGIPEIPAWFGFLTGTAWSIKPTNEAIKTANSALASMSPEQKAALVQQALAQARRSPLETAGQPLKEAIQSGVDHAVHAGKLLETGDTEGARNADLAYFGGLFKESSFSQFSFAQGGLGAFGNIAFSELAKLDPVSAKFGAKAASLVDAVGWSVVMEAGGQVLPSVLKAFAQRWGGAERRPKGGGRRGRGSSNQSRSKGGGSRSKGGGSRSKGGGSRFKTRCEVVWPA